MEVLDDVADLDGEVMVMPNGSFTDDSMDDESEPAEDGSGSNEPIDVIEMEEEEYPDDDDFDHDDDFESNDDEEHGEDESDFDEGDDIDTDEFDEVIELDEMDDMPGDESMDAI